jgi:putative two-component system response regulator
MERIIYIADDIETNIELIEIILKGDPELIIKRAENGKKLLELIENEDCPDLLILDLMMPVMDGFEVLKKIKTTREDNYFPIIVLSALSDKNSVVDALKLGADDYIIKPFFVEELKARVYNMLKLKERDELLERSIDVLETNLFEKLQLIEKTQTEIINRLGKAAEFRDDETGKHIERIADYVELIADYIGMADDQKKILKGAAPMHDVGKIGIPDSILLKPGKLTDEEFNIIKLHTIIGGRILSGTTLPLLELAKEIALTHHERYDGTGYPFGLAGEQIPLSGRIVALIDVFDALTSDRIYKAAWPMEKTLDYIKEQKAKQFDPILVDAFMNLSDKIIDIKIKKADQIRAKPLLQQIIDGDYNLESQIEQWR